MRFYGITGTNGKTTTVWIFAEFINAASTAARPRKCGYITTVEVYDGRDRYYTGYTTPPLAQLREIYARMAANGCTDCVMEVSSHAIHQHRTGDTVFAGGAFTNLSEDHLDYHKTMAEYFRVKRSFAEQLAAPAGAEPTPYAVCLDGENGREMYAALQSLPGLRVLPVSFREPAYDLSGLQLIGDYNRSNVLTAAALAEAAGVEHATIQATIPGLKPRWGRLERVANAAVSAEVYVDFAHTPDGLDKVLAAVRATLAGKPGRLWVVFGAGGDRDPMKRPLMGAAAARHADRVVITSDNPRSEDPERIIAAILAGVPAADRAKIAAVEADRLKAIEFALGAAAAGDIVVIAGKGHETTQEIQGVKHPFDDREVVRNYR